ncbi:hypothetical protein OH77DRAFT_1425579 [Trametes cingulata]|nr:hypothetical protein OH77DRAFT_1425579 [Trametes cingulata]
MSTTESESAAPSAPSPSPQPPKPNPAPETRLKVGAIYLLLFIRDRDPAAGFHWALYHHRAPAGGYKFNVKQLGAGWLCDSAPHTAAGIMRAFLLAGALRIGYCDPDEEGWKERMGWIDEVDLTRPPEGYEVFTCRTWTMGCVRGLVRRGYVTLKGDMDVDELEKEAKEWGLVHHESAHEGILPRPVEDSRVCVL